ncbi:MAG TPA: LuxR C-terminal-related transcriptional regulator [Polyangiaceae bacterium]|jgi:DNA-binding NarL/FixJ family response regulator|nr:LuxR C-terminal-related transcriptional regulator [Polyangiaceae bacterium]
MALLARYAALDSERPPAGAEFFWLETNSEKLVMMSFPEDRPALAMDESSHKLTAAEMSVLQHVLLGHSNRTIARARRRSVSTVGHQVASIFRKLGVSSRRELLATLRNQTGPATTSSKRAPAARDP